MFSKLNSKIILVSLRLSLGWLFFYAGFTKVINPDWSAAGYLSGAKTFTSFYSWLASSDIIIIISFVNQWALTLLGLSLLLGLFVRLSSSLGALLMFLYYLPILEFPLVGSYGYLIDEHIIYILVLVLFVFVKAGRIGGLDKIIVEKFGMKKGIKALS